MTCCEDDRIESKAPISFGSGSALVRVKALGHCGCLARAKKSSEWMCSVTFEKRELRVNPIFFWHGFGHFFAPQKNKFNKINSLQEIFYLNFGGLGLTGGGRRNARHGDWVRRMRF